MSALDELNRVDPSPNNTMHRCREAGRFEIDYHWSRPGDCGRSAKMTHTVAQAESQIERCRVALDDWLDDAYADIEDKRYYGEMDASFPNWGDIESVAGRIFDNRLTSQLSSESLDSLFFFILRSDEIGSIIAWLTLDTGTDLSRVGRL